MFAVQGTGSVTAEGAGTAIAGTNVHVVTVIGGQHYIDGTQTPSLQLTAGLKAAG